MSPINDCCCDGTKLGCCDGTKLGAVLGNLLLCKVVAVALLGITVLSDADGRLEGTLEGMIVGVDVGVLVAGAPEDAEMGMVLG
jgi:hypothetical protein